MELNWIWRQNMFTHKLFYYHLRVMYYECKESLETQYWGTYGNGFSGLLSKLLAVCFQRMSLKYPSDLWSEEILIKVSQKKKGESEANLYDFQGLNMRQQIWLLLRRTRFCQTLYNPSPLVTLYCIQWTPFTKTKVYFVIVPSAMIVTKCFDNIDMGSQCSYR